MGPARGVGPHQVAATRLHFNTSTAESADPAGVTTKLNLPGAALTPSEAAAVVRQVVESSRGDRWLVLVSGGSGVGRLWGTTLGSGSSAAAAVTASPVVGQSAPSV